MPKFNENNMSERFEELRHDGTDAAENMEGM